jgi:acyl-coenzyme A synthetase/AMP-(fatty) acid ligase
LWTYRLEFFARLSGEPQYNNYSFEQMRKNSNQVANFLRDQGLGRGDTLLIMLDDVRNQRPLGLMQEYRDDPERMAKALHNGFYRTGDVASRDDDGYYWYAYGC